MSKPENNKYHKTKHDIVDEQHGKVFKKIKTLSKSIQEANDKRTIFHLLFSLLRYSEKHFLDEERLMFLNGYKNYPFHKQQHGEFISKIGEIKALYDLDPTAPNLSAQVEASLGAWFHKHIKHEDTDVVAWLSNKKNKNRFIMRN